MINPYSKTYEVTVRFKGEGYADRTFRIYALSPREAREKAHREYQKLIVVGAAREVEQS